MEIRNVTSSNNNSPAFGMAFIKPSAKVMQQLEKVVEPRSFEAFVKEQANSKYFDITADVAYSYKKGNNSAILFKIVPKQGVDTLGYGDDICFHSEGFFDNYIDRVVAPYKKDLEEMYRGSQNSRFKTFLLNRVVVPMFNRYANKEIKDIQKNHPERMVLPALRAAGDKVNELEKSVDRAAGISKIFEA